MRLAVLLESEWFASWKTIVFGPGFACPAGILFGKKLVVNSHVPERTEDYIGHQLQQVSKKRVVTANRTDQQVSSGLAAGGRIIEQWL